MSDFFGDRVIRKTRKQHQCESCHGMIPAGSKTNYAASVQDGQFFAWYQHLDCKKAEYAWNKMQDLYDDEWMWLWQIFDENEPTDIAWLVSEYPSVAGRMRVSLEGCERPQRVWSYGL